MPKITDEDTKFLRDLMDSLKKDLDRQVVGTNFASAKEKREFIQSLKKILKEYNNDFSEGMLKELDKAWQEEANKAVSKINGIDPAFKRNPSKNVLDLIMTLEQIKAGTKTEIDNLFDTALTKFITSLNNIDSRVRNQIMAELASGNLTGSSIENISLKIQKILLEGNIPGFTITDKNGKDRSYSLESSANRIARHGIVTARQRAVIFEAVRGGYDLIRVPPHSEQSPMCQPHSNKIYSITGITEGYPLLESALWNGGFKRGDGLGHYFCRHSFQIYVPDRGIKFKRLGDL